MNENYLKELSSLRLSVCVNRALFHHQLSTCKENVKFRAVQISIYCPELQMFISEPLIGNFFLFSVEIYLKGEPASILGIRKGLQLILI